MLSLRSSGGSECCLCKVVEAAGAVSAWGKGENCVCECGWRQLVLSLHVGKQLGLFVVMWMNGVCSMRWCVEAANAAVIGYQCSGGEPDRRVEY